MQSYLNNELRKSYDNEGIITMVDAELTKIEKSDAIYGGEYYGTFKCTLNPLDSNDNISLWGDVGFDKNKRIKLMPKAYGDNKAAIDIFIILINSEPVADKNSCKYILNRFMNRNKISGNEK